MSYMPRVAKNRHMSYAQKGRGTEICDMPRGAEVPTYELCPKRPRYRDMCETPEVAKKRHMNCGAWTPSEMSGVPREVIEHHLAMCPNARPVKQKARRQAPEKQDFSIKEVEKLKKAHIIREVVHPTWLADTVVVPKHTGEGKLCID